MDKDVFGGFIAALRKEAKLTQQQVADALHVTDRAVSKWERGLNYPDVTLMEPLAAVLGVSVEELLTCQKREPAAPEPELPALRSVLTITQEEKRIRTRRRQTLVWLSLTAALVLTVLATMQHNGKLLMGPQTTSPDGSITLTVYQDSFFDGRFYMKLNHAIDFEGPACPYCGRGTPLWTDRQELTPRLTTVEALSWSADSRYLLIRGAANDGVPLCLELWDFRKYGQGSPVHREQGIALSILQQLSGYDACDTHTAAATPVSPAITPEPLLPALPGNGWLPRVTLSDVQWSGGSHHLTMTYAYDGTDGEHHTGRLLYDADTGTVLSVKDTPTTP